MKLSRLSSVLIALCLAPGLAGAADGIAGPYLAGRVAGIQSDYRDAADYFAQVLAADPGNTAIMESALLADLAIGDFDKALPVAQRLSDAGVKSSLADLTLLAGLAKAGQYDKALALLDQGHSAGPLVDGLYRAWALAGRGQMTDATAAFDKVAAQNGLASFALFHKALALALVGDFEGADKIFSGDAAAPMRATRRSLMAQVEVLSQLERNKDAMSLIDKTFGPDTADPAIVAMRADLQAGKTLPFDLIKGPQDGLAEMFFSVASALAVGPQGDGKDVAADSLLYARTAAYLRPDFAEALLLVADALDRQGQHELAIAAYQLVAPTAPTHISAEIGRADALVAAGRPDAAIEALQQLAKANPGRIEVLSALGDALRRQQRFADAIAAYDKAVALIDKPQPSYWVLYYTRGIANERENHWDKAEPDFRKALELNPDQPQVLNYLGYSYLERNIKLDDAMSMIERAAKAEPTEGPIADSLGWALYRLGRYADAEVQMEKAISLMPADSVVNDHLGDVYWAVGRKREAEFQWKRALSFKPDNEADAKRIRRKLEVGLDAVLKEEGAPPLAVTTNGG